MSRSTHWPTVDEPPRRSIRQLLAMGWRRTSPGAAVGGCGPSILPRSPWRPRFVHAQRPDGAGKPTWKQEPRAGEGSPPRVGMFGATPADWDNRVQAPACRGFQGPQGLCGDCLSSAIPQYHQRSVSSSQVLFYLVVDPLADRNYVFEHPHRHILDAIQRSQKA
jgi:hypothetical protein